MIQRNVGVTLSNNYMKTNINIFLNTIPSVLSFYKSSRDVVIYYCVKCGLTVLTEERIRGVWIELEAKDEFKIQERNMEDSRQKRNTF